MEGSDYLLTCAEVAVALAGFSALVVAIQQRGGEKLPRDYRHLVSSLIERSLVAVFLSLLPLLLSGLAVPPDWVWSSASVALAVYIFSLAWRAATLRQRARIVKELVAGPLFYALYASGIAVIVLQLAHAAGLGIERSAWWYMVGLTWLMGSVGYLFYFAVRGWARSDQD